jgi:F-type H+-transporting ATPase subunit alpha
MKQKQYSPLSVGEMAISLFAADRGYLDDVDVKKVVDFEDAMISYCKSNHGDLINKINETGAFDEEIENGLAKAIEDFKANGTY